MRQLGLYEDVFSRHLGSETSDEYSPGLRARGFIAVGVELGTVFCSSRDGRSKWQCHLDQNAERPGV